MLFQLLSLKTFLVSLCRKVNRGPNNGGAEVIELNNNFENPAFNGEPVYEAIPEAANTAPDPILRVGANNDLHELGFPDDRNAIHIDQSGNRYDPKNENISSDPRTGADHPVPRAMENLQNRSYTSLQRTTDGYAHLHRHAPQGQGMRESENEEDRSVRDGENYTRPANSHYDVPRDESRIATRVSSDTMKLVNGNYKKPRQGRRMLPKIT